MNESLEIIVNISNHPIYTSFTRKALVSDLTKNIGVILFKLEVSCFTGSTVITDLNRNAQFVADSISTMQEGVSDYALLMTRVKAGISLETVIADAIAFLDSEGILNKRLGIEVPIVEPTL